MADRAGVKAFLKGLLEDPAGALTDAALTPGSLLRYGVTPAEKHQLAMSGAVPGTRPNMANMDEAVGKTSGYLFGKRWPTIAPPVADGVAWLRKALGEDAGLADSRATAARRGAAEAQIGMDPEQLLAAFGKPRL